MTCEREESVSQSDDKGHTSMKNSSDGKTMASQQEGLQKSDIAN